MCRKVLARREAKAHMSRRSRTLWSRQLARRYRRAPNRHFGGMSLAEVHGDMIPAAIASSRAGFGTAVSKAAPSLGPTRGSGPGSRDRFGHYAFGPSSGASIAGTSSTASMSITSARSGVGSSESSEYLSMRKRSRYMNDAAVPTFRMSA